MKRIVVTAVLAVLLLCAAVPMTATAAGISTGKVYAYKWTYDKNGDSQFLLLNPKGTVTVDQNGYFTATFMSLQDGAQYDLWMISSSAKRQTAADHSEAFIGTYTGDKGTTVLTGQLDPTALDFYKNGGVFAISDGWMPVSVSVTTSDGSSSGVVESGTTLIIPAGQIATFTANMRGTWRVTDWYSGYDSGFIVGKKLTVTSPTTSVAVSFWREGYDIYDQPSWMAIVSSGT